MAIPEVICFGVVTQDLSYNYICRRWTPNWGCPCRKQYVLLQETMAQTAQAACALDMSCVSWQTKSSLGGCWIHILSWIRKNIREKQTRAAWLINFKHHHEEVWISGPGQKKQEFVRVKSSKDGFRFEESRLVSCLQKRIYMGVSKNRVTQNGWFILENPVKMDDLGGTTIFENTYIAAFFQKTKRISSSVLVVQRFCLKFVSCLPSTPTFWHQKPLQGCELETPRNASCPMSFSTPLYLSCRFDSFAHLRPSHLRKLVLLALSMLWDWLDG